MSAATLTVLVAEVLRQGHAVRDDLNQLPAQAKHWHGAAADGAMTHNPGLEVHDLIYRRSK